MASKNPLLRDNVEIVLHILTIMETIYCNPGVDSKDIMGWKSCDLGITLREKVKIHISHCRHRLTRDLKSLKQVAGCFKLQKCYTIG